VQHPYLGIQMVQLSPDMKDNLNRDPDLDITVTAEEGVIILRVLEGTPAQEGGLQKGDIIESVNGVAVETPTDVQAQVDASQIGEPLAVVVKRDDKTETIEVNPMALPQELQ
jgi:S1-C subfamily serine protease